MVIVDDSKRGKGYGKKMLTLAIKYAFDIFGVKNCFVNCLVSSGELLKWK